MQTKYSNSSSLKLLCKYIADYVYIYILSRHKLAIAVLWALAVFLEISCVMGYGERGFIFPDSLVLSWCLNKTGMPYLSLSLLLISLR